MGDMNRFFIRGRAGQGYKAFLADPETDEITDEWMRIRSRWSDEFQEAKSKNLQEAFEDAKEADADSLREASRERRLRLIASLVAEWSFSQPCTLENIVNFLREAPQIADQIDKISARDRLFFGKASGNSSNGAETKSGSDSRCPAQKTALPKSNI